MNTPETLPIIAAAQLPRTAPTKAWLVEHLWGRESVGILAGHPKSGKSWLGLDLALSVASGTPCLGRYAVPQALPTVVYLAEDALPQVRQRLETMARHRSLGLDGLALYAIAAAQLRLDCEPDRQRLENTVRQHRPGLLLLDPLVRLHQLDENDARSVSGLLSYLRRLQREYRLAVLLVHHARKNGGEKGLALRGSSDLWAWGDSNLYLRRGAQHLTLTVEHRSAPAIDPVALALVTHNPEQVHLELLEVSGEPPREQGQMLAARLSEILRTGPQSRTQLRAALGVKNERLGDVLAREEAAGTIRRTGLGWSLCTAAPDMKAG
jgi:hypothetical protein